MSTPNQTTGSGGSSIGSALFILFTGLKLTGYINWSWWAVTAPLWVPLLIVLGILAFIGILLVINEVRK